MKIRDDRTLILRSQTLVRLSDHEVFRDGKSNRSYGLHCRHNEGGSFDGGKSNGSCFEGRKGEGSLFNGRKDVRSGGYDRGSSHCDDGSRRGKDWSGDGHWLRDGHGDGLRHGHWLRDGPFDHLNDTAYFLDIISEKIEQCY